MGYSLVEGSKGIHKCYPFMKKSFQFLALVTFSSAVYSYFSGFPLYFYYNLHFSTLIFPLLGQALDRNFMFLVCNAILAFLAKNVKFTHATFSHNADDGVELLTYEPGTARENEAPMDHADDPNDVAFAAEPEREEQLEQDRVLFHEVARERETTGVVPESADSGYYNDELDNNDEDDGDDEDWRSLEATGQVTDARVSTEELNKKFEEFIRKMKEEIRVEAQQPLITV